MLLGIDVSRYQGYIDWDTVKNNVEFAIIKAGGSDDGLYEDSRFGFNLKRAREVNIPRGFYYFVGGGDPLGEAIHFHSIVGNLQDGELVALDFEINHPDPVGYCLSFLRKAKELFGVKPLFYSNQDRIVNIDWSPIASEGYGLWCADYYDDNTYNHSFDIGAWSTLAIYQYTSTARLPGISENVVDMDVFYGDLKSFLAYGKSFKEVKKDVSIKLTDPYQVGPKKWRIDWADFATPGIKGYWLHLAFPSGKDAGVEWNEKELKGEIWYFSNGQEPFQHKDTISLNPGETKPISLQVGFMGAIEVDYDQEDVGHLSNTYIYEP